MHEDFYNFVEVLCANSMTSGIAIAETQLIIFPTRIAMVLYFSNAIGYLEPGLLAHFCF